MIEPDPTMRAAELPEDNDRALRPQALDEFIGQAEARANLKVFIESARRRGEAMDHTLFHGPPGLGKTTLAQIMSRELGVNFRMTSGPVLAKAGDLAAILTNLEARDVLFIDEIHRLNPVVEEILYPALEDFELDLVIGEGPAALRELHQRVDHQRVARAGVEHPLQIARVDLAVAGHAAPDQIGQRLPVDRLDLDDGLRRRAPRIAGRVGERRRRGHHQQQAPRSGQPSCPMHQD